MTDRQNFLAARLLRETAASKQRENDHMTKKFAGARMPAQFLQPFEARAEEIEAFNAAALRLETAG
jgi:hypothetical protein